MDEKIVAEIEEPEQLAHLSATHSNALVENPFD
ncbi:streptamidine family RiPP [Saccharomonospora piscinae]|nr:streptamidine family RiPP [Saccharomonospora piscinae]